MIIVEGPDGAGKTTLIKYLEYHIKKERFDGVLEPISVIHSTGPHEGMREHANRVTTFCRQNPTTILDRFNFFSESVYGPLLRPEQESFLSPMDYADILHDLQPLNPLVIICLPSREVLLKNLKVTQNDQMPGVCEAKLAIYEAYTEKLYTWSTQFAMHTYDYTCTGSLQTLVNVIKSHLRRNHNSGVWNG